MRDYIKLVEQAERIVEKKAKPPSKFKPTHFHLSNLSGIFGKKNAHNKLMFHDGAFWHMKRDDETGKKRIAKWSGNPNNRSKLNPASVDGEIVGNKLRKFPKGTTFADSQRETEVEPNKQGIDGPVDAPAGTDTKGRKDGPDALKPGADKGAEAAPKDGKLRLSGGETFYRTPDGKGLRLLQKHAGGLVKRMDELVRKMNESVPNSLKSVLSESDRTQLMLEALSDDEAAELVKAVDDLALIMNFKDEQGFLISDQNRSLLSDRIKQYATVIQKAGTQIGSRASSKQDVEKKVDGDAEIASDKSKDKGADKKADEKPIAGNLKKFAKSGKGGLANDPDEVEAVKELQQYLTDMGFDPNGVDGKYGGGTVKAVKEFQEYFGAKVDGDAGPETIGQIIKLRSISFKGGKTFADFRKDMSRMEELIKKGGAIEKSTENSSRDFRSLINIVEQSLTEALSDQEKKELDELIAQYDDIMNDVEFAQAMPKISYDRYKKIIDGAKKLDSGDDQEGDGGGEVKKDDGGGEVKKDEPKKPVAEFKNITDAIQNGNDLKKGDMVLIGGKEAYADIGGGQVFFLNKDGTPFDGSEDGSEYVNDGAEGYYRIPDSMRQELGLDTGKPKYVSLTLSKNGKIIFVSHKPNGGSGPTVRIGSAEGQKIADFLKDQGAEFIDPSANKTVATGTGKEGPVGGAKPPVAGSVEPRPGKNMFGGNIKQRRWDEEYGETHNPDGTPKAKVTPDGSSSSGTAGPADVKKKVVEPGLSSAAQERLNGYMNTPNAKTDKGAAIEMAKKVVADKEAFALLDEKTQRAMLQISKMK